MQVQAMALAQERRRKAERAGIAAALLRIEAGEFGYCIECGDDIAEARLKLNPTVMKCRDCAAGHSCSARFTGGLLRSVNFAGMKASIESDGMRLRRQVQYG